MSDGVGSIDISYGDEAGGGDEIGLGDAVPVADGPDGTIIENC
jgi:hypothetical protein